MKPIPFKNNNCQRVYNDYIKRCNNCVKTLPAADREECLMEINSHIYEYLEANAQNNEMDNLLNILERLGPPEETLKEFVADKKINQAVKTWNPLVLAHALYLNIRNGLVYIILFFLFIFIAAFPVLIVLKLIYPQRVGCYMGDGSFYFGLFDNQPNVTEVLGNWFIPVCILLSAALYFIIIILLKIVKRKK